LIVNLVLPPIVSEMYARGQTGRLERTLRTFSTLAGVPSLLVLMGFMLLGGPILGLVYSKTIYSSLTAVLVLLILSAAKLTAVWSGSCGLVLQFTGYQSSMLRVSLLTSPLFLRRSYIGDPTLRVCRGRLRSGPDHSLAERDNGLGCQEEDRDVDPRYVLPLTVSQGLV
jgi:O-antigen/teichoic acid export membrane protein